MFSPLGEPGSPDTPTRGIYTSELLLTVVGVVAAVVLAALKVVDGKDALQVIGLAVGGYSVSRGIAKRR